MLTSLLAIKGLLELKELYCSRNKKLEEGPMYMEKLAFVLEKTVEKVVCFNGENVTEKIHSLQLSMKEIPYTPSELAASAAISPLAAKSPHFLYFYFH